MKQSMTQKHVAFIVESSYGHIVPTLGIASELIRRGYRVSYAVNEHFAPKILQLGAQPVVYQPLCNKIKFFDEFHNRGCDFSMADAPMWERLQQEEAVNTLSQLETLYQADKPHLIVYDYMNLAGRLLASKWGVPRLGHSPAMFESNGAESPYHDDDVMISIPEVFHKGSDFDHGLHFVGFIYNDRKRFFRPWRNSEPAMPTVLASATTGLLPQTDFFRLVIRAFENLPWHVVLSVGDQVSPISLGVLPDNVEINQSSSNLDILEKARLFVGQGGEGSVLESLYCGVPLIIIPPSAAHEPVAIRIAEHGLGIHLEKSKASAENLRKCAVLLSDDMQTLRRVAQIREMMRNDTGADKAIALVEKHINCNVPS